jgi:hypothetical protein
LSESHVARNDRSQSGAETTNESDWCAEMSGSRVGNEIQELWQGLDALEGEGR